MPRRRLSPYRVITLEDRGSGTLRYRLHHAENGVRLAKGFATREEARGFGETLQAGWLERLAVIPPPQFPDLRAERYVYCIKAGVRMKVGMARNPLARLRQMQTGNAQKLVLVAHKPGGRVEEAAAHMALREHWDKGEWFRVTLHSLAIVNDLFR